MSRIVKRLSPGHVVFLADALGAAMGEKLAADLVVGDRVFVAESSGMVACKVLGVEELRGQKGMYAPLTASGTIVVDGVVASNYAAFSVPGRKEFVELPNALMHATFSPFRAYHALGFGSLLSPLLARASISCTTEGDQFLPYATMLWKHLGTVASALSA